jgi:hypothetical protein
MIVHPFETKTVEVNGKKVTFRALTNMLKISRDQKVNKHGFRLNFAGYDPKRIKELVKRLGKLDEMEAEELTRLYSISEKLNHALYLKSLITLQYILSDVEGIELAKVDEADPLGRVTKIVDMDSVLSLESEGFNLIELAFEADDANRLTDEEKKSSLSDSTLKSRDGNAELAENKTSVVEGVN